VNTPLPAGFRIELAPDVKQLTEDAWFGGSPSRVLRLTAAGRSAWEELASGPVRTPAAATLARRLTDTGFAHPCPPAPTTPPDVTVVVPVRDRAAALGRCLAALGNRHPVVVVDDGSHDPRAVAEVAARHGAKLLVRTVNGGPGAARDTGLGAARSALVAFVDSDCVPPAGWLDGLVPHLADPLVAAVAPRIVASGQSAGWPARFASALDLGDRPASVAPNTRVAYVPTAALLVRRGALDAVARGGAVFDPGLRVTGEDVDLVWRLHEAGWRIRYEPSVEVPHEEPASWAALLRRRYRYGLSAAPLARRHPGSVPPLVLFGWPAATVLALLARKPVLAAAAYGCSVLEIARTLRAAGLPTTGVLSAMGRAAHQTWLGVGRYGTQFAAPLLAVELLAGRHRLAAASLLFGPPLTEWARQGRGRLDPARYVLGRVADDVAYGGGVLAGCLAERTLAPVRPRLGRRPLRIDRRG
jgi:mycofactocin system glycosyltransferase